MTGIAVSILDMREHFTGTVWRHSRCRASPRSSWLATSAMRSPATNPWAVCGFPSQWVRLGTGTSPIRWSTSRPLSGVTVCGKKMRRLAPTTPTAPGVRHAVTAGCRAEGARLLAAVIGQNSLAAKASTRTTPSTSPGYSAAKRCTTSPPKECPTRHTDPGVPLPSAPPAAPRRSPRVYEP